MTYTIGRRAMLGAAIASLTAVVGGAVAQPGPGPGRGPMGGPGSGMMGGRGGMMGGGWNTASYLASLKSELNITPNQEAAWKNYADAVSGTSEQMQGLHQTMFDAMGTASSQERRDMMNGMFEARQQAFDTVHDAANKLLLVLDPSQKAKAEQTLPGLAFRRGMMRGR
jgi:LTXXQ motif family protein